MLPFARLDVNTGLTVPFACSSESISLDVGVLWDSVSGLVGDKECIEAWKVRVRVAEEAAADGGVKRTTLGFSNARVRLDVGVMAVEERVSFAPAALHNRRLFTGTDTD